MPPGGFPTPRPSPNPTATPSPTGTPVPTGTPPPTPPVPATPPVPPMPALPDPAAIRAGIAQLDAGLGRLSSGLGQARAGLARLDDAAAQLADAKATVEDLRQLADIAADTQSIAVELAGVRREDAVVRAMSSGRVVESAEVGDVLAPGATVAVIAPASAAHVSTWVPVDAVRALEIGTEASVRTDSAPGKHFPARVTRVGEEAGYPPTSYATREVHLLRSVEVEFELTDPSVRLPRGTPATVEISRFQDEG